MQKVEENTEKQSLLKMILISEWKDRRKHEKRKKKKKKKGKATLLDS